MSEQFNASEEGLIERLHRAPQPELRPEALEAIRARLLDALDHPPAPAPRPHVPHPVAMIVVVMVTAALIIGSILLVLSLQTPPEIPPTVSATLTTLPAIASPTLTLTATTQVVVTLTHTPLPTANEGTITVVEGPVEHIAGNIITIYGVQVQIDPNDPILITISIGDMLRVEGNSQTETTQIVIVATTVVFVNVNVNVSPSSGEVWRDDGDCSHPPPDWAPANGWRRRCEGQDKGDKHDKDDD